MFKLGIIASAMRRMLGKLLDLYPNASAAYSLRKLRDAYTGSAIRVRRSTDNTEQDIGFDLSGNLDESALTTFVGNGNAFVRSEEFDNAIWSKNGTTATANQTTAPDGTTTADLIAETATTAQHNISNNTSFQYIAGRSYTLSVYLKKGSGATAPNIIQMNFPSAAFSSNPYANFNINTGVVVVDAGANATITAAANGFYRCTISATASTTTSTTSAAFQFTNNSNIGVRPSYLGQTTSNVFAWGAQLNAGSTATTYVATTANQAGFGYVTKWYDQSGTPLNQFIWSEQFQQGSWTKESTTATADQTTAPDGTTTADIIAESAVTNRHGVYQLCTHTNGVTYTLSSYFKKGSGATAPDIVALRFSSQSFSGAYANFNISTGVVTLTSGCTASITNVGSGWYRCSITATAILSGSNVNYVLVFTNNNPSAGNLPSYLGVTTSNVFAWGAQLVEGSLPLTYTKTEAANSNRDVVQTTAANQPQIVTAGEVQRQDSKPTVYFDGSNDLLQTSAFITSQPNTSIVLGRQLTAANSKNIIDGVTTRQYISANASNFININAGTDFSLLTTWGTTYRLIFAVFNGASSKLDQNNTTVETGNAGTNALSGLRIGGQSTSAAQWSGFATEAIIYPSDQLSNKGGIETDINTYYTIY